jgi:uncharacterized protein
MKMSSRRLGAVWLLWMILIILLIAGVFAGHALGQAPDTGGETGIWAMRRWSPYVVGFFIGVLSWASFLLSDKPLGVSTAYARTSGMLEGMISGPSVKNREYYQKYVPKIDWEWMLVVGLLAGAFVSALLSGDFRFEWVPPLWEGNFGLTGGLRWFTALVGGVILGIGARWADGCTSGHGISGTLQLVVSSWIALACFFIGGIISAFIIYY